MYLPRLTRSRENYKKHYPKPNLFFLSMFQRFKKEEAKPFVVPEEIGEGVPMPPHAPDPSIYTVKYTGPDDPTNPHNWKIAKKCVMLFSLAFNLLVASWGSAIGAPALPVLMEMYHIGQPVAALTVSLYVIGFAVGPIFWGPISSIYGRRNPLIVGTFGMLVFFFAAATAENFQTYVISRFFQGAFGAAPLTIGPAIAGDIFNAKSRGYSMSVVSFCVMAGPLIAPIVGGYITQSYLGWRWTQYITGIMAGLSLAILFFITPETYPKTILNKKAHKLRDNTGNWAIQGPGEFERVEIPILKILLGAFVILFQEVILGLVTIFHGLIYSILYMCLEAVPIVFSGYNFPGANAYLPYIAILVGAFTVCSFNGLVLDPWTNKQLDIRKKPVLPENRLILMMISGFVLTAGIFWMCWGGAYAIHVHWIVPCIGAGFLGFGMVGIFISIFNYILDAYLMNSAMAFAANTLLRSGMASAFPLFSSIMFRNLGSQWAGTLIGCLSAIMIPIPFVFYLYGPKLRSMSKLAVNLDEFNPTQTQQEDNDETESVEKKDAQA